MEHQYTVIPFYSFLMSLYSSSLISIVKSWSMVLIPDCGQWGINNVVILIIFYESKFSTIGKITIASLWVFSPCACFYSLLGVFFFFFFFYISSLVWPCFFPTIKTWLHFNKKFCCIVMGIFLVAIMGSIMKLINNLCLYFIEIEYFLMKRKQETFEFHWELIRKIILN